VNIKLSLIGCIVLASLTCSVSAQSTPAECPAKEKGHAGKKADGKFGDKLGLTDDQKAKIGPLVQKNRAEIKAIRSNDSLTKEQKHQQISAIRQNMDLQMKAILTPEQYQKFEGLKAEMKGQRGNKGKGQQPAANT
jgi:Spy/CpxP family protein refolding chaperone